MEKNTLLRMDVSKEGLKYDELMTRIYLADALPEERAAIKLLLLDMSMDVIGEAGDWETYHRPSAWTGNRFAAR